MVSGFEKWTPHLLRWFGALGLLNNVWIGNYSFTKRKVSLPSGLSSRPV